MPFARAADLAAQVFNYTNHTIMQEALEKWDMATLRRVSPAVAGIVRRLSRRFDRELDRAGVPAEDRPGLQILQGDTVHMAHLACRYSAHINGVAQLHTDILRRQVLHPWHRLYP